MLIYDVLKKDHEVFRDILRQMEQTTASAAKRRRELLEKLREELIPHTRAEEKVFYDTLKEISETEDLALEGYEEHSAAENLLRDLELMDPSDQRWQARLSVLKENLENHIKEEEDEIFASARQVIARDEAKMMAQAFKALKENVKEGGFVAGALERVGQFMPVRFSQRFQDVAKKLTT